MVDGCEILHHLVWLKPYEKKCDKTTYQLLQEFFHPLYRTIIDQNWVNEPNM